MTPISMVEFLRTRLIRNAAEIRKDGGGEYEHRLLVELSEISDKAEELIAAYGPDPAVHRRENTGLLELLQPYSDDPGFDPNWML